MITHFAELELQTVSLIGVKQVYANRLGMPIIAETSDSVAFELTPHTALKFVERYQPIAPAHFAFEVPHSTFAESVEAVEAAGLIIIGDVTWDDGMSLYFRDGDGHILEIYAHDYIPENVLPINNRLKVMYLREVGFPVEHMPDFRAWLASMLSMRYRPDADANDFCMVIGGTAHAVVVNKTRPWIPIAMMALSPNMCVTFGTPNRAYLEAVADRLRADDELISAQSDGITFTHEGYLLALRHVPDFPADLPVQLNLPLAGQGGK